MALWALSYIATPGGAGSFSRPAVAARTYTIQNLGKHEGKDMIFVQQCIARYIRV